MQTVPRREGERPLAFVLQGGSDGPGEWGSREHSAGPRSRWREAIWVVVVAVTSNGYAASRRERLVMLASASLGKATLAQYECVVCALQGCPDPRSDGRQAAGSGQRKTTRRGGNQWQKIAEGLDERCSRATGAGRHKEWIRAAAVDVALRVLREGARSTWRAGSEVKVAGVKRDGTSSYSDRHPVRHGMLLGGVRRGEGGR